MSSVLKRIAFHPNIDFAVEDIKSRRRLETVLQSKKKRETMATANEHFLETITNQGQLRNIARAYDNRIQLSTLLGLLFTQVGLTNPNFGVLGTLSATEHNLTYLLGMLAQAGGINAMNQDAVATLTTIRQFCEGAGLYAPGAHRIILPKVTPDGQQRPGLGANFRGGEDGGQPPNAPAAG